MILKHTPGTLKFERQDSCFTFLPSGDIYTFTHHNLLVNDFIGSLLEGSANNIWLRIYRKDGLRSFPLLGISSGSMVAKSANGLRYTGAIEGVSYAVTFTADSGLWFWNVELFGSGETVDIVYGQDVGLAEMEAVLENELYVAQYLGHTVLENEHGYVICSRQNIAQNTCFPYLQQGMLKGKAVAYSTDGVQFFGTSYKATNRPEALSQDLACRNLQFECSYIALQSEKISLSGSHSFVFYGCVKADHKAAVTEIEYTKDIETAFGKLCKEASYTTLPSVQIKKDFGAPYVSPQWDEAHIAKRYPERRLEERSDTSLLSFFTPQHAHVVLQQKELMVERPHGNIITTQMNSERVDNNLITSTNTIYGLFNGQTVIGNTSKHKLLSTPRGLLNILKNSGQRLWIRIDGTYRLLTLPVLFEMGMNYSRWFYDLHDDVIVITSFATAKSTEILLEVASENGKKYDFIVTNQLVMGYHEFNNDIAAEMLEGVLRLRPDNEAWESSPYPALHYDIQLPGTAYTISDDGIFFEGGAKQNGTLLTISVFQQSAFQVNIRGALDEDAVMQLPLRSFEAEKQQYLSFYARLMAGFALEKSGYGRNEVEKLNEVAWWYTHNAMVHFSVPHGLEQSGGAAWGTRDISQGPMEFFFATQNYKLARSVLLNVFAHQSAVTGEWPQWFMFDKYTDDMGECHGDVVFWPLKCVGNYLEATGDISILEEVMPYSHAKSKISGTLLKHIKTAVSTIETRFLDGTALISYAGGDWDDTLQPANEELKQCLVSSWTQALAYQVLSLLSRTLAEVDPSFASHLGELARQIKAAFERYLIIDGVIAGFIYRTPDGTFLPMLHPKDDKTGMRLRLLPMTRSILANIVDFKQAAHNVQLIEQHLHCPDGVRLMDRPAPYKGGVSSLFRRAEQAANVGREISLQYTHAHIRYIEAMCHFGRPQAAWKALFEVNPVNLQEAVPNALPRQSNMYFSSSEGAFYDRYEYDRDFDKLSTGGISVKGGWRLYSSGPGIYLHQLIAGVLGIRFEGKYLVIDPVLPQEMDGLRFRFCCFGIMHTFVYHITQAMKRQLRVLQNGQELLLATSNNPFRSGGVLLDSNLLDKSCEEIHIMLEVPDAYY